MLVRTATTTAENSRPLKHRRPGHGKQFLLRSPVPGLNRHALHHRHIILAQRGCIRAARKLSVPDTTLDLGGDARLRLKAAKPEGGLQVGGLRRAVDGGCNHHASGYGNGNFIVRGFGPLAFQMNGGGEPNPAVNKAAGRGQPVTQEIAISMKGGRVECVINGAVVAGYNKAALVTTGKLKSLDGVYGLRFAHNTDVTVTGLTMTKN